MYSFMEEPMSLDVTGNEIFNSIYLNNLEFFQCKIWVNLFLIRNWQMDKIKGEDLVDIMVKDLK